MKRQKFSGSRIVFALIALLPLLVFSSPSSAQTGTSSVRGTISDPQGNVIAGGTVTLTNVETNYTRTQTTNDNGAYAFELIPPGEYRVEIEALNFKKALISDVRALVAKPTEISVALEIGNVAETVTVTAGAGDLLLNTQDATLGNNFESRQITQLPLEARNVVSLLTLQPGTTRDGYVAGARSDQSNVTLDGVDINEQQTNDVFEQVLRLNAEAIEEFRVTTVNANAQAGRSSGAQISLVTKSGKNAFNGALFEFHRPTILAANDFFNNRSGVRRPTLIRNTFGGAIGGPVVKDRAFFFYSYEGRRESSEQTVLRTVPLASLGRGEVRYVGESGEITTLSSADLAEIFPSLGGINPAAVAALADAARRYPANDFGTTGDSGFDSTSGQTQLLNTAGYRFNVLLPTNLNSHAGRFDLNLTDKQTMFARVNIIHDPETGYSPAYPDTGLPYLWSHPFGAAVGHTWAINNNFVNNFRYGLTREAFTSFGDAAKNEVYFRFIFFPTLDSRTIARTTPTHNFTDDLSWVVGNHTAQFGTNVRAVRNRRTSFANAFDTAYANPTYYQSSGRPIATAITNFSPAGGGQTTLIRNAATALIGRLTTYTSRFTFDKDGNLLPSGSPTEREFATEEYEFYGQDSWKIRPNLTLSYGVRYSLSRPVYETQGYETKPLIPLSEYFQRRIEASARGENYIEPIVDVLSGPANDASPLYPWDKNNFQPRVAFAWSPNVKSGFLGKLFGTNQSVIRGGFTMTNDFLGQQIATRFDLLNSVGFTQSQTSPVAVCNLTTRPCPLFTSYTQDVRSLPRLTIPTNLTFPSQQPADLSLGIQTSFDEKIVSPTNYSWNLTFERQLPKGFLVQASYLGRLGRDLLASRDVLMPNNLTDPRSGQDYYTAAGALEDLRRAGTPIGQVQALPFFENTLGQYLGQGLSEYIHGDSFPTATQAVYAAALDFYGNDWVTNLQFIDEFLFYELGQNPIFYSPQYGALSSFGTVANSNYHGGTLSIRQRLGQAFTMDFNYTLSKSFDDASGLQTSGSYGTSFILNPLRQRDNYAVSDFDVRHIINSNAVWQIPIGRGRSFLGGTNRVVDAVIGGWQMSGIFRYNSGAPTVAPYDVGTWATNYNAQSYSVRLRPVQTCPTSGTGGEAPNIFGCNRTQAYQSFRSAKPGETGDRNIIRLPSYVTLDMGLNKSFAMPWSERHRLELRFEAFNVTNTQRFGTVDSIGLELDPFSGEPPPDWGNFSAIQGDRRVMQFGFRYSF